MNITQDLSINKRRNNPPLNISERIKEALGEVVFISAIKGEGERALEEAVETTFVTKNMSGNDLRSYKIEKFFNKNDCITNADIRQMFNVASATANRILAKLVDEGKLQKIRLGKSWGYTLIK